jgi:hypothetical protein
MATTAKTSLSPATYLPLQYCNAHKGPNLSGLDPESGALVRLFHPRQDRWDEHFEPSNAGVLIVGRSAVGRADDWLVEDERRRSASASRRVAFYEERTPKIPTRSSSGEAAICFFSH